MKASLRTCVVTVSIISLVGCANTGSNYRPVVDTAGIDSAKYQADVYACQEYARQVASCADRAAVGAILGAVIGLGLAAVVKDNNFRGAYAGVGALSGASGACEAGERDQRTIIARCLSNRGYSVLN